VLYNIHAAGGSVRSTIPILWNPEHFAIFTDPKVLHNLIGGATAMMMGGMYFILGFRFNLFFAVISERFSTVYWYEKGILAFEVCRYNDVIRVPPMSSTLSGCFPYGEVRRGRYPTPFHFGDVIPLRFTSGMLRDLEPLGSKMLCNGMESYFGKFYAEPSYKMAN